MSAPLLTAVKAPFDRHFLRKTIVSRLTHTDISMQFSFQMRTHVQAEQIRLITMVDVNLEGRGNAVALPKHTSYPGIKRQLAVRVSRRSLRWTPVEYTLSVGSGQEPPEEAFEEAEAIDCYDVTKYVQLGLIIVRAP